VREPRGEAPVPRVETVSAYDFGRNPLVPAYGWLDLWKSGPSSSAQLGVSGQLFTVAKPAATQMTTLGSGSLLFFRSGWIFVPPRQAPRPDVFAPAKLAGKMATATFVVDGLLGLTLPLPLAALAHTVVEQVVFGPEKPEESRDDGNITVGDVKRGVYLDGASLVRAEHQRVGLTVHAPAHHRVLLTYEDLDGKQRIYGSPIRDKNAGPLTENLLRRAVATRAWAEISYLLASVGWAEAGEEEIWAGLLDTYQQRYGDNWQEHAAELQSEADARRAAALDARHFGREALCAEVLRKLSADLLHSGLAEVQPLVQRLQRRAEATPDPAFSWATSDPDTPVF